MKSICKNMAFSESGECFLGEKCICEADKSWLEELDIVPNKPLEQQLSQDALWDEVIEMLNHEIENAIDGSPYLHPLVKQMLSEKYTITRK